MNKPIVQPEPFWPVGDLERRVTALTEDNTSLCELVSAQSLMLADKNREIALLQDELTKLKAKSRPNAGVYHFRATRRPPGRYVAQRNR